MTAQGPNPTKPQESPGVLERQAFHTSTLVEYTPITNRVSRAKKGKAVHVCGYGCGKVWKLSVCLLVNMVIEICLGLHPCRTSKVRFFIEPSYGVLISNQTP